MRIGIDAKSFFNGPVSTQVVLQNLLPELITLFPDHHWIIFLDKNDKQFQFPVLSDNIELHYVWANINMISNVFLLSRKLKSLQVDVMLYQMFPALSNKVPAVCFIHDVLFRQFPQFFTWKERMYFSPLAWLTRNRSERVIATTEFVSNDLLKYNYIKSRSKIDIVPLAVNKAYKTIDRHDPKKLILTKDKYQLPDRFLLFVGRLNVRKNIENLLKAFMLMNDEDIQLVIVGKADWKTPNLKVMLDNPKLKNRIIMTGAMTDEELIMTYSMARIFCFPSFAEGFGLPPLEAMASGVPVIVSDTTAFPEVCGAAGIYINPYSPESIANAINGLLGDSILYETQKAKCLKRAGEFSWTLSARALMASLHKAANNK